MLQWLNSDICHSGNLEKAECDRLLWKLNAGLSLTFCWNVEQEVSRDLSVLPLDLSLPALLK